MAKYIWAETSPEKTKPSDAKIKHGFDFGEKPSHETFNWVLNYLSTEVSSMKDSVGIPIWDPNFKYQYGQVCRKGLTIYQSTKSGDNVGIDPAKGNTDWFDIFDGGEY